ncbi:MAG: hypothetical protein E6P95_02560 [Candidatus Moraniibacteriota bacterium]|nr:MAG: hypothetical protein E6P95_02560 [Candidatus Moranbacteria bacterium]
MAPPTQSALFRRFGANFHRHYGEQWMNVLCKSGYIFMGDSRTPGTRWAPPWNPTRVLTVPYDGKPVIWRNACPHNGKRLVKATDMPVAVNFGQPLVCGFHSLSFDHVGQIRQCGHMTGVSAKELPEQRCKVSPHFVWPGQDLVFELGQNADRAKQELHASLAFVDEAGRGLFDFADYRLHCSLAVPQKADALMSIVNYLDIRHVRNHRETLAPLVDVNDYQHRASDSGAGVIQFMGVNPTVLFTDLGKFYQRAELPDPEYGAAWMTTPLGWMLEAYLPPHGVIVVSQCFPHPERWWECTFYHDFYYHKEHVKQYHLAADKRKTFIGEHQDIFKRTGDEDELWCGEATEYLRSLAAEGRGGEAWGFLDPGQENYGHWYYQVAEERLRELVGR